MKAYFNNNLNYFNYPIFVYIVIGLALPLYFPKGFEVEYLSNDYNPQLNAFFDMVTKIAEWQGILAFAIIVLYFNRKKSFPFSLAILLSFALITFLKRIVFADVPRPRLWATQQNIQVPEIASTLMHYSFPSGHSAMAVCMFFCLAVLFNNRSLSLVFSFIAILVVFSRVYIMAHFVVDTAIGAMVGLFLGILGNYIFDLYQLKNERHPE
jgi:membrane-associated phospholipid phosphatase